MATYRSEVKVPGGQAVKVQVQAPTSEVARKLLDATYGKGNTQNTGYHSK